ncbi:unnamed protein product [Phytomonas sp. EM1]|nr:unnamed protein product [Phytomonas sp. EM1]|eukprot:CCW62747.1 unnamed protein product [Phytomonas sp. isolate EM1]
MGLEVFEIDLTTPHHGVFVDRYSVQRETNGGWVTLRARTPLTAENHQWAVRILDQGEGSDGSGLMLGLLPQLSPQLAASMESRYISELGGWCLSRAGDSYGSWKCEKMHFFTGCVVEFDWDATTGSLYIVCGKRRATGIISAATEAQALYPAISMYYLNQKVAFV